MSNLIRTRRPSGALIVGVIALVMAMSGSAVAGSLITSKQIKDGTIQKRDLSKRAIRALTVKAAAGVQGPQGPKGDKGDTGATGDIGARGPSDGFTKSDPNLTGAPRTSSIQLPGGSYLIEVKATGHNPGGTESVSGNCELLANDGTGTSTDSTFVTIGAAGEQPVTLLMAATYTSAGAPTLECGGSNLTWGRIRWNVLRVATLTHM